MSISITPTLIMAAAEKRGWKARIISERFALYRLDTPEGDYYYIRNITSNKNSAVNAIISSKKEVLYSIIAALDVPVPATEMHDGNIAHAAQFLAKHGRIVVKPTDQSHGNGVTTDITTTEQLEAALSFAGRYGKDIILQQHIIGDDYRLLYIDGVLAAAAIREPASVVGDGHSTIAELIELENNSPRRGEGYNNLLTRINTEAAERYLGAAIHDVPAANQKVLVVGIANIGKGGVSIDATDTVDPAMVETGKRVIDHFDMGLCGVDFIQAADGKFYFIEMNAGPSLGLHENPYRGKARNTPDKFLDWLAKKS